jgi:tRNA threonylcarbamoyladenosine biosynthesis protein TsaE
VRARTTAPEQTRALAAALAELCRPGDILLLAGEMGSGKTAFAQGLGDGLGVGERVTSPTFTIVRDYDGRIPMHHIDVYRLDHLGEVFDLGIAELLDDGAVTLIEWGDVVVPAIPADFLEIRLSYGSAADDRHLAFRSVGAAWSARTRALEKALDRWIDPDGGTA